MLLGRRREHTLCQENRKLFQCNRFNQLDVEERQRHIKHAKLSLSCLKKYHYVKECRSSKGKYSISSIQLTNWEEGVSDIAECTLNPNVHMTIFRTNTCNRYSRFCSSINSNFSFTLKFVVFFDHGSLI